MVIDEIEGEKQLVLREAEGYSGIRELYFTTTHSETASISVMSNRFGKPLLKCIFNMSARDVKALTSLSKNMFMVLQFPHLSHAERGEKGFSVC